MIMNIRNNYYKTIWIEKIPLARLKSTQTARGSIWRLTNDSLILNLLYGRSSLPLPPD